MSGQVQRDQVGSFNDEVYDQRNLKMKIWKEEDAKLQTLTNHHLERSQTLFLKNPWEKLLNSKIHHQKKIKVIPLHDFISFEACEILTSTSI